MTLIEVVVSVALGTIVVAIAVSLWLFGSRSFAAMGNYADLEEKSRNALDLMSRDLRQATGVTGFQNQGPVRWLTVTDPTSGTITYTWQRADKTLVCQKAGEPDQIYLTECDTWDFDLFQRTPQKGGDYLFFPATNAMGAYDLSICKLINMSWTCSRRILGNRANTESVQTAQIVLRNKQ